jgi:hypothetical protein
MAEYKPSFVFQSKILSLDTFDNSSQNVGTQADQTNTLGTVNQADISSMSSPLYDQVNFEIASGQQTSIVKGGGLTQEDVYSSNTFKCQVILEAVAALCGPGVEPPECDPPKERAPVSLVSIDGGKDVVINCICVDNTKADTSGPPTDNQINDILDSAADCLRAAREDALSRKLNQAGVNGILDLIGSEDTVVDSVLKDVKDALKEILRDSNLSPAKKAEEAERLLERTGAAIQLGDFPVNPGFEDNINAAKEAIDNATNEVNDDCALNTVPGPGAVRFILRNMSNKPRKVCDGGKELNEETCECVCPSGTVECPSTGNCVECDGGEELDAQCECACPSGTVRYTLPTNEGPRPSGTYQTSCIPECPPGYVFKEVSGGDNCDFEVAGRCYKCLCRLNSRELIEPESCPSGSMPDPSDSCSCKCTNPNQTYVMAGSLGVGNLPPGCYCNAVLEAQGNFDPVEFCEGRPEGSTWDSEECSCLCPSGSSAYAGGACECDNPDKYLTPSGCVCNDIPCSGGRSLNDDCECVCPSGTNYDPVIEECACPSGSTPTTPNAPTGGSDCSCPSGQTIQQDPSGTYVCASGAYSYTSLTTYELRKIAAAFGYTNTVEFL